LLPLFSFKRGSHFAARFIFFFLVVSIQTLLGQSNKPLMLTNDVKEVLLSNNLQILEDVHSKYTVHEVSSSNFDDKFKAYREEFVYGLNADSVYWIRFYVNNISHRQKKWVIEILSIQMEDLEVYIPSDQGNFVMHRTGQQHPFRTRDYSLTNFVFDLPDMRNSIYPVYIRIKSPTGIGIEGSIKNQSYFTSYTTTEYFFLGLYYGFLIILIIYNLLLMITSKEVAYLFYTFYIAACVLVSFEYDGLGFQFLWPDHPFINHVINGYLPWFLFIVGFIFYAQHFIGRRHQYKKIYLTLFTITFLDMGLAVFGMLPEVLTYYLFMAPLVIIYTIAIDDYRKGTKANRYFIVGQSFLLLSIFITISGWFGVLESNLFTVYSFNAGVVLEAIIFSYAFIDKYNITKMEKEKARQDVIDQLETNKVLQTKVNRELEMKVQERTLQLQEEKEKLNSANEKLEVLMAEVNKMNSKLDFDNWHLNKKVNEVTLARIRAQEVSFEEFTKVFPTEFSCFSFLEKLKWEDGYRCIKCNNDKYTRLSKLLSRRCSKCLYIESVTTATLFHALKFPISKAFYIVYHCSFSEGKTTVDELSSMLDLRRNTCWNFKKKVVERLNGYSKDGRNQNSKWEYIMLDR
jgi:two-component system, sensor histidine kinase LadS